MGSVEGGLGAESGQTSPWPGSSALSYLKVVLGGRAESPPSW